MPSSLPRWPAGSDRSWDGLFQPFPCSPAASAFPMLMQGRRTHWTFRGLLNVHSRYGLPARCIAKATHVSRRLRRLRYLHRRSDSYRPEQRRGKRSCKLDCAEPLANGGSPIRYTIWMSPSSISIRLTSVLMISRRVVQPATSNPSLTCRAYRSKLSRIVPRPSSRVIRSEIAEASESSSDNRWRARAYRGSNSPFSKSPAWYRSSIREIPRLTLWTSLAIASRRRGAGGGT